MQGKRYAEIDCPIVLCQQLLAGKWKIVLLYLLSQSTLRFNEMHRMLSDITPATLNKQLKELVDAGLVSRKAYDEIPPKVEYSLSARGELFKQVLISMQMFGEAYKTTATVVKNPKRKQPAA